MAGERIRLGVYAPGKTVVDTEVDFVLLRTREGDMGVLHGHEPCTVALDYGLMQAYVDKEPVATLMVMGGFASVRQNEVVILSAMAEPPDQIEAAIRATERERSEVKLKERVSDMELQRAENALRRTLVQMDVSTYSIIKGNEELDQ